MAENTQVAKVRPAAVSEWQNTLTKMVAQDYTECGLVMDDYSKKCAMSAMSSIYELVKASDKDVKNIDISNLREIVGRCASLKLNATAFPRECYFQLRSKKTKTGWVQTVEMGIEGDGYDSILQNFGEHVKRVMPVWVVHEGDDFVYPRRRGLEVTPPEWEEKGLSQKVARVVYPVVLVDNSVQYLIAERDSVKTNLFAHVRNNLMNETFGICKNRFDATDAQIAEINAKKEVIYEALRKCDTLDDMLECAEALPYISAAWRDSQEEMITRKLRNNAVKKFKKNFDGMAQRANLQMDDSYQATKEAKAEEANSQDFDDSAIEVESVEVE